MKEIRFFLEKRSQENAKESYDSDKIKLKPQLLENIINGEFLELDEDLIDKWF